MRPVVEELLRRYLAAEREQHPRGVRRDALVELLTALDSVSERHEVARRVLSRLDRVPGMQVRHELRVEVLVPYLRDRLEPDHLVDPRLLWWARRELRGDDVALHRYRRYDRLGEGMGHHARIGLAAYACVVTGEARWWRTWLADQLDVVDYGTHHMDLGRGVVDGPLDYYLRRLCAAIHVWNRAPSGALTDSDRSAVAEQWELLRDWLRYDAAGRPGDDFPGWCRGQGSCHWVTRHTPAVYTYTRH